MINTPLRAIGISAVFIFLLPCFHAMSEEAAPAIIPLPLSMQVAPGAFSIDAQTALIAPDAAHTVATYLALRLRKVSGFKLPIRTRRVHNDSTTIVLRLAAGTEADTGEEGYRLSVRSGQVDILAATPAGLFYGVQTLLQMLPPDVHAPNPPRLAPGELRLPQVEIADRPRFSWRGLMIDVSRHFFSKQQLKKTIDAMAMHKLNVLHLHLTDDPGWRVEIEQYPKLTSVGAIGDRSNPRGPARLFFSKDDIRDIVEHARQQHILVVPEIDMPGHAEAAARAYPEFFDGEKTFNPANPDTYQFVKNILTEIMGLFPSGYLHFGGDEVRDHLWADLPEMDSFMQEHGYTSLHEVEEHFDRFVSNFIAEQGYTPIGWDEVVAFDVSPKTIVQWWLHLRPQARDQAIAKGHRIIISPTNYLYFDYPNAVGEPGAPWEGNDNGPNSLELIHQWEPVPDSYTEEEEAQVLGLQANLWTEFITTNDYYEYMIFPRLSALAEIAWSPKGNKDLDDFKKRLEVQCRRYEAMHINYRTPGEWPSDFTYITN